MTDVKRIDSGVSDDDVFAAIAAGTDRPTPSVLAGLREELARKVVREPVALVIPDRPTLRVVYSTDIDAAAVQAWRRKARSKDAEGGVDTAKFSVIVIANQMVGLQWDDGGTWVDVVDDDGEPLTFRGTLTEWLIPTPGPGQTRTVTDGVRHLYGSDAAIFRTVEAIFTAAGYSDDEDEVTDEDPTVLS